MAKTAKLKKRQVTMHSRAARRAVSPSIDLDKSLKPTPSVPSAPPNVDAKPHVLAAQSSGITKKSKSKQLKRQQNARRLKGMDRAEDNIEKLALKVQKSLNKEKKIKERRKGWEEVNEEKPKLKGKNAFTALADEEEEGPTVDRKAWGDEEMAGAEDGVLVPAVSGEVKELVVPASVPLPAEDEVL